MRLPATSLGVKLNLALLVMVIALGAASLIIIAYGFSRTQDDATHLSREGLEEQGKLILAALAGGSAESGGLQLESAAEAGQRSTRYLEDYKAANGEVAPVDTSEFEQTSEGVWYDPDPNRASDIVVINGASPEDNEVAYDLAYSAPLEPLLPALSEGFPGEFAADAYHPIAITYIGISGAARYYPPIGIEETTPPGLDLSNLYDEYGPISNPNRETIWTSPYQDIVGQFVITAQTPVYDGDDFRGIFQVDLSINELLDQVNGIRPTANSFAFYVDTDGEILQTDAYSLLTSEAQDNPELAAILDSMTNPFPDDGISVDSVTLAGNEYFLAHGAMPSVGGGFAVAAPVDELSEQAALITSEIDDEASRSFGLMVIAMSALFVAALIGVTYLNSGLLLAPLRRLSEGTRAVAAGDLDTKVDLQRGDELGMLADSFNSMVEQLRESERHLERQVEERTAELRAMIEISRSLASAQNLRALVETILAEIKTVIDYTGASVVQFREDEIEVVDSVGPEGRESNIAGLVAPIDHTTRFWHLLLEGQPVVLADARGDDQLSVQFRELISSFGLPAFSYIRSWMAVPLLLDGRVIGMLTMSRDTADYFDDHHIELAQTIARQAAVVAANARLLEETQRTAREKSSLFEVSRAMASTLDLSDLLGIILDQLHTLVDYAGASVTLREGDFFRQVAVRRPRGPEPTEADISQRLPFERVANSGFPMAPGEYLLADDVHGDDEGARSFQQLQGSELNGSAVEYVRSFIALPLIVRDRLVGMLMAAHDTAGFFNEGHVQLLRPIADQAAIAIDNAQLLEQTRRAVQEQQSLLEVSSAVASSLDLAQVTKTVLNELEKLVGNSGASILTVEGEDLIFRDAMDVPGRKEQIGLRIPLTAAGMIWDTLSKREPVVIPDINADERMANDYRRIIGSLGMLDQPPFNKVCSWMAVPLFVQDRIIGMLSMSRTVPDYFTPDHARLAGIFADNVAVAIENARLFERVQGVAALEERQRLARELHDSVSQALYGIALGARTAKAQLERDPGKVTEPVDYILSLAEAGLAEMRSLIFELRPESMEKEGLVAALDKQVAAGRARYGIDIQAEVCDEPEATLEVKEALYRIAQEALHNVVKHARATRVSLSLAQQDGRLILRITDDGAGFDPGEDYAGHLGLKSMRERAALLGGKLVIDSVAGGGTTIVAELPAG